MVISDGSLRAYLRSGHIGIEPFDESRVQPASIDLTLGDEFKFFNYRRKPVKLTEAKNLNLTSTVKPGLWTNGITIEPGVFCLGTTAEVVRIPSNMVARVEGKSSLGRLGLIVHATAGFCDPGFHGRITLEFANLNSFPLTLEVGQAICQLSFSDLDTPALRPYGHPELNSKYQHQKTVTESRYAG